MAMNNPYQKYQQNSIMTASPQELTLMLYNGAIKFLNLAKADIENNKLEDANNNIKKVEAIIEELMGSLDMSYEISNNLYLLYDFMYNHLVKANFNKHDGGLKMIDEVTNLLKELRDTWEEAMKITKLSQRKSG